MKIYTRDGDDGTTGLLYGGRVRKDSDHPAAYGDVDEAQAAIGWARAQVEHGTDIDGVLIQTTTTADGATGPRGNTWETTWPDIGGTLLIGNYRTADNHEFQGEIGPVRCYKGNSLSDGEVLQNFNAQRSRFGV